ncbi:MAG TPA: 4Fe-4S binding protein [Anaerolineales bacterium]|nr:4Fe-4S binding protein [Anaerolineales bacterium]
MSDTKTEEKSTANAAVETPARKGPRGQVVIFANWCKGCSLCVDFCPTGVLVLDEDEHPVVAYPEKCTACHWCDTHCPDFAIVVKKIE